MLEHSLLDEPKQALAPTVTTPAVPVGFAKQHYTTIDPYLENCTTDGTDYCNGMTHTSPVGTETEGPKRYLGDTI